MPMKEKRKHDHSLSELGLEHHRFTTKSEIKPWLKKYLLVKRGINIVIERSDSSKIIFKCKTYRNHGSDLRLENGTVKRSNCPFKIRANYSVRNRVWTLVVINDLHNHDIETRIDNENKMVDIRNGGLDLAEGNNIENTSNYMKISKDEYGKLTDLTSHVEFPNTVCYHDEINKPGGARIDNFRQLDFGPENSGFKGIRVDKSKQEKSKLDKSKYEEINLEKHNLELSIPDKFKSEDSKAGKFHSENSNSEGKMYRHKKRKKSRSMDIHNFDNIIKYLKQEFHSLIENNIYKNEMYNEIEKGDLFKMFLSLINEEYKDQNLDKFQLFDTHHETEGGVVVHENSQTQSSGQMHTPDHVQALVQAQSKSGINTWLTTPNTPNYALLNMNSASNTNLIPLSPLLNDAEAEYQESNSANVSQGIDSFIHLPGINLNAAINQNAVLTSNQMLQIQNQAQQLPSFNFIQNQLPASPNGINTTASLFGNNVLGYSSLIPPINNSNSMTLNPLHLLKSSAKNASLNPSLNQSTSLSEFRINNSSISTTSNSGLLTSQSLNSNHMSSLNAGLSSPNNNIIN